jgi:hypothetical protein
LFARDPHAFPDTPSSRTDSVMMGDIVQTDDTEATLDVEVIAQAPIERVEVRNGTDVVETLRPYDASALGARIRVLWSGAEYRGRGRDTNWMGQVRFEGASIRRMEKINAWNHERLLEVDGADTVVFDAITTGNYGGFDVWLDGGDTVDVSTNLGALRLPFAEIGLQDRVMDAGGLERRIKVFRLPETLDRRELSGRVTIPLKPRGDNPLWVSAYTEDGFQAWSSPVFAYREDVAG